MRTDAKSLRFKGHTLANINDLSRAQAALMCDIVSGAVSPKETRICQKELDAIRLKLERKLMRKPS